MKTLEQLIGAPPSAAAGRVDSFFAQFGMARNPFPTARTIIPQVIYNQDDALSVFANRVRDILGSAPEKRSLSIVGGTGAGKTHFLRHCQYLLSAYTRDLKAPFVVAEFPAGNGSVASLWRDLLLLADEACKRRDEYDLLAAILHRLRSRSSSGLGPAKQVDLQRVLGLLLRASEPGFIPPDRDQRMTFDPLRELVRRWLSGAVLTQTERKYIGVFSRLGTASLMTRVLSELFALARELEVLSGLVICLDEIEALFTGQSSTGKVQGFLQDLRYMFDEATREATGYSLLIISAGTLTGTRSLRDFNYPLYQRLGFEGETRVQLEPIQGVEEVRQFARTYAEFEQERSKREALVTGPKQHKSLLTDDDLDEAFKTASAATSSSQMRSQGSVNQGQLLEALHNIVEGKRPRR